MADWSCNKCRHQDENDGVYTCCECRRGSKYEEKSISWGDKIRSMSDEELAEFFANFTTICEMCIHYDENCMTMTDERCREGILKWLKSEVKE